MNFVLHGWTQSFRGGMNYNYQKVGTDFETTYVYDIASNWAKFSWENVCAVDWSHLASFDYMTASAQKTRIAANGMMQFMDFLIRMGMIIQQVSVAGHSLGSHVAGFFGAGYKGELKAIYSLFHFYVSFLCSFF